MGRLSGWPKILEENILLILWRVDLLLSGDSVSSDRFWQRLGGTHDPVDRQQILNNATVRLQQWERNVSTWHVPRCYKEGKKSIQSSSAREAVKR
jgi:hypothetical protein